MNNSGSRRWLAPLLGSFWHVAASHAGAFSADSLEYNIAGVPGRHHGAPLDPQSAGRVDLVTSGSLPRNDRDLVASSQLLRRDGSQATDATKVAEHPADSIKPEPAVAFPVVHPHSLGAGVGAQPLEVSAQPLSTQPAWFRNIVFSVLRSHPEILQYEAEARSARFRYRGSLKNSKPSTSIKLQGGIEGNRAGTSVQTTRNDTSPVGLQLSVTMPLIDAAITADQRRDKALFDSADWTAISIKEQYAQRTVETIVDLLRSHLLVELSRKNLESHRRYLKQVKDIARVDIGRASDIPVAQSRVALAESVLANRLGRQELVRAQWRQVTTLDWSVINDVIRGSTYSEWPKAPVEKSVDVIIGNALVENATLAKARSDVQAARRSVDLARAQFLPTLNSEVRFREGRDLGTPENRRFDYYVGISLDWRLPINGMRSDILNSAYETLRAAERSSQKLELEVRNRIESEWFTRMAAEASMNSYKTYVETAEEVLKSTQNQFKIGRKSLLDVLNSENELFTAKSNAITSDADQQISSWRLLALQGLLPRELGL